MQGYVWIVGALVYAALKWRVVVPQFIDNAAKITTLSVASLVAPLFSAAVCGAIAVIVLVNDSGFFTRASATVKLAYASLIVVALLCWYPKNLGLCASANVLGMCIAATRLSSEHVAWWALALLVQACVHLARIAHNWSTT
jgi:hypothetical protein